mgnify:CR=1 FL=1
MIIRHRKKSDVRENEVTDERTYHSRRDIIKSMGVAGVALAGAGAVVGGLGQNKVQADAGEALDFTPTDYRVDEDKTPFEAVTSINNFYEFGMGKDDPARYADEMSIEPWTIEVEGHCDKPGTISLEDLVKPHQLEERIYRFRCVEAWSMVIPWIGVPLGDVLKRFEPNSRAKYVAFQTKYDRDEMRGVRYPVLDWPYREGLRMDEAMNPLALLAVGLYGKSLLHQNGAPLRLVVPWKYGFKSIKSIVRISFVKNEPKTSWNMMQPSEYGFYSTVNPKVDHPRWSQARERRIGELYRRETLMFNGYEQEVAHLYKGMDLKKYF